MTRSSKLSKAGGMFGILEVLGAIGFGAGLFIVLRPYFNRYAVAKRLDIVTTPIALAPSSYNNFQSAI